MLKKPREEPKDFVLPGLRLGWEPFSPDFLVELIDLVDLRLVEPYSRLLSQPELGPVDKVFGP